MAAALEIPRTGAQLLADPQQLRAAYNALNSLLTARRKLVRPQAALQISQQLAPLFAGDLNGQPLLVQEPYLFAAAIADPTGGATVDTQCRAQLALLLAQLRIIGMLPT